MGCFPHINNPCKNYPNARCVVYTGNNLTCSGISTNDRLDVIIQKIDEKLCQATPGEIFLEAGSNISIVGDGTEGDPYIISFTGSFENPLTFSTGLARTGNIITVNLSTGVSGGQSVIGGTQAGNDLTLSSTTHSTKGNLFFGNSTYDEVNNRLGIKTISPSQAISIEEKLWIYRASGVIDNQCYLETPLNQELHLQGNTANSVFLVITPLASAGSIRFSDDLATSGGAYTSFFSSGATEQGRIGIDPGAPNEFYLKAMNSSIISLYDELRFDSYPSSRNDGITSVAFYPGANGEILVGPVAGSGGTAISQTSFSGNNVTQTFNIPHGLAGTPKFLAIPVSNDAQGVTFTADSTNIIATYAVAPPTGTNNIVINWAANL